MSPEFSCSKRLSDEQRALLKSNMEWFVKSGVLDRYVEVHRLLRDLARRLGPNLPRQETQKRVLGAELPLAVADHNEEQTGGRSVWLVKVDPVSGEVLFGSGVPVIQFSESGERTVIREIGFTDIQVGLIESILSDQDSVGLQIQEINT